jgi:hypothetical protein
MQNARQAWSPGALSYEKVRWFLLVWVSGGPFHLQDEKRYNHGCMTMVLIVEVNVINLSRLITAKTQ